MDPTREQLDKLLLERSDHQNHFQAFNIAKAVLDGHDVPVLTDFASVKDICLKQREEIEVMRKELQLYKAQVQKLQSELGRGKKYRELYFNLTDRLGISEAIAV